MNFKKYGFSPSLLEKREKLLSQNINPYPYTYNSESQYISSIIRKSNEIESTGEVADQYVVTSGRIWAKRDMGKIHFFDLKDQRDKIQIYLNEKMMDHSSSQIIQFLDIGDIVGVSGKIFRTRTGELTIQTEKLEILSKTVVPIPIGKETDDKIYYRASDPEIKYRERYLHWNLDTEDRNRIELRSQIINEIRNYMQDEDFLEVSTPTIEFVYGGAEARPFKTSIWALDNKDAFLRISPELYLKRYLVAGFNKVFTICQNFRNEGIDYSHNPEFTMMEWYEAYTDYNDQMNRFESLVEKLCLKIHGSTKVRYQNSEIEFKTPWKRISIIEAIQEYSKIDVSKMSVPELKNILIKKDITIPDQLTWGMAIILLFENECEKHLIQPTFITDHPVDISPLTKIKRGDVRLVERFEPYIFGMEIGNAYSELNDPVIQVERLESQRNEDDFENHPVDADFVKAIGCGMPPTGGVGFGVDRIIMLLTNAKSIRDIIPFPMIKPKNI